MGFPKEIDPKKVEKAVKDIICEQLGLKEVKNEQNLSIDLNVDELDMIELCMVFEEKWGIDISDEDAERLTTVKDAVNYIIGRTKQ